MKYISQVKRPSVVSHARLNNLLSIWFSLQRCRGMVAEFDGQYIDREGTRNVSIGQIYR